MLVSLKKRLGLIFSLNDPQWGRGSKENGQEGKKPNNEPPDLDQVWQDFTQGLAGLFGRSGGNGSGGNGGKGGFNSNGPGAKVGVLLILAVLASLWLLSGAYIVQEGHKAVITTFGKYTGQTGSGFNWRWPAPIQDHELVNVSQVRTVEVGYRGNVNAKQLKEALMLTDDENIIDIQFAVQYKLSDAAAWVFNNRDQDEMIRQVAETAIREIVGKSKMDFVLYEGREKVALDMSLLMQRVLNTYKAGVQITNVTMQAVQPPEQVQASFDDAVKAGQDKERQKNEGQAYANEVIPKARGEASRMLQEAEAYKSRVVSNAQGNAERFKQVLVEYQKAPAVTRDRMYLETMQQIFSNTSKIMMDAKTGNNMIYLPLDKIIGEQVQVNKPAPAPIQQESVSQVEIRGAKENRTRDRESR
jgi:membrane protease subunit HflK